MKNTFVLLILLSFVASANNDNFLNPNWWGNTTLEKVKKEISNGADVNIQDDYGWTPLMRAVDGKKYNIVRFLINTGADISIKNKL